MEYIPAFFDLRRSPTIKICNTAVDRLEGLIGKGLMSIPSYTKWRENSIRKNLDRILEGEEPNYFAMGFDAPGVRFGYASSAVFTPVAYLMDSTSQMDTPYFTLMLLCLVGLTAVHQRVMGRLRAEYIRDLPDEKKRILKECLYVEDEQRAEELLRELEQEGQ